MAADKRNKEAHYSSVIDEVRKGGVANLQMGVGIAWAFYDDPKRLAFTFARYKFATKMLSGCKSVLEVGCGDGFATRLLRQEIDKVAAIDVDDIFIKDAIDRASDKWPIEFFVHDMISDGPFPDVFEAAVCLDVIEHVKIEDYPQFLKNLVASVSTSGVVVVGAPSAESQEWASPQSKLGHVSCQSQSSLKSILEPYFTRVFMFSMNDEIIHTGFSKMSHYNLALCVK